MGSDGEELAPRADGVLGRAVEASVVDGDRGAARHVLRQLEIRAPIAAPRRGRGEGEHPEHLPARHERHRQPGLRPELAEEPHVLVVLARRSKDIVGQLGHEERLPGAEDRGRRVR